MNKHQAEQRRRGVLDYIIDYKRENDGLSPSIREIMRVCEIASTSTVVHYLERLEREGRIKRLEGPRGIMVIGGAWSLQTGTQTQS